MDEYWPIASKVLAVFAVMGAGAAARAVGWLTAEADKSLMRFTVNILLPCLFFNRVVGDPKLATAGAVGLPPLIGFGTTVFGYLVAGVIAAVAWRLLRLPTPSHRRSFTLCTGMYNYGYIPLPIAEKFFPGAVATLMVHNVGVELALWTVGVLVISGGLAPGWWRRIINPPAVGIVIAVVVNVLNRGETPAVPVPELVMDATRMLGNCAIPMGLALSGAVIVELMKEVRFLDGCQTFVGALFIRVGLLPVCFLLFAKFVPLSLELKQVVLLQAAMPAASFPLVVTKMYGQDTQTALKIVAGTTVLGILTIPIWLAVGKTVLGL